MGLPSSSRGPRRCSTRASASASSLTPGSLARRCSSVPPRVRSSPQRWGLRLRELRAELCPLLPPLHPPAARTRYGLKGRSCMDCEWLQAKRW
eukprot:5619732-Alexandrium_andersonii.AAC.1